MRLDPFSAPVTILGTTDFLAVLTTPPWPGDEHLLPLSFHDCSRIELQQGTSSEVVSLAWFTELVRRVATEHNTLQQTIKQSFRFIVTLSEGELVGKGSGEDVRLAQSHGLYYRVSHLLVEDSRDTFFSHHEEPDLLLMWSHVKEAVEASYENVRKWVRVRQKNYPCS